MGTKKGIGIERGQRQHPAFFESQKFLYCPPFVSINEFTVLEQSKKVMSLYENLSLSVLLVTVIIMVVQIRVAVQSLRKDHLRRKLEGTLEHMNQIREKYRLMNAELIDELGIEPLDEERVGRLRQSPRLWEKVKDILGLFEHLAIGVNLGVFDLGMLEKMSGTYLSNVFRRFSTYIRTQRESTNNPTLYQEYEKLVEQIAQIRSCETAQR